jgi:predicted nucleic acid-binding protein
MPLVIDTNVWVAAYTPNDKLHRSAKHILFQVLDGEHQVYLPCTGLVEIVCKLSNILIGHGKNPDNAIDLGDALFIDENIKWIAVDREFAYSATMFGRLHRLRGMDALLAYTALKCNCELLTADGDFFKSASKVLKIRHLNDV